MPDTLTCKVELAAAVPHAELRGQQTWSTWTGPARWHKPNHRAVVKQKEKKPSFIQRMKARGREAQRLGKTLKDEPGAFPGEVQGIRRRSVRTVWSARGEGLYACGCIVTFVFLEI
jgi:hypothetical protein